MCHINTGGISVEGSNLSKPRLDMNGYSSTINSLLANSRSEITNFASSVTSTLAFGVYKDGTLNADVNGNIDVVKSNATTTLTVYDTSLPQKFTIAEGVVRVVGGSSGASFMREVVVESGATLVVDGAVLNCVRLTNNGGTLTSLNGGKVVCSPAADGMTYYLDAENVCDVDGVHVSSGKTLVFSGDKCTNEWWRFRFNEMGSLNNIELGRIQLVSSTVGVFSSDQRLYNAKFLSCELSPCDTPEETGGGLYAYSEATATAACELPRGKVLLKPGVNFRIGTSGRTFGDLDYLFDCRTSYQAGLSLSKAMYFANLAIDPADESSWVDVTFRLNESKNIAKGYSFFATKWASPPPCGWVVESSPDGIVWERMDSRSGLNTTALYFTGHNYNWYENPDAFAFTSGHMTGAKGFSSDAAVQVDAGGILDCSMVDGGQSVSALVVDASLGCGTFKGVSFAASGTIDVCNWNRDVLRNGVPFAVDGCSGVENIEKWSVLSDGAETQGKLFYGDGCLYLKPTGMMLIVQ